MSEIAEWSFRGGIKRGQQWEANLLFSSEISPAVLSWGLFDYFSLKVEQDFLGRISAWSMGYNH